MSDNDFLLFLFQHWLIYVTPVSGGFDNPLESQIQDMANHIIVNEGDRRVWTYEPKNETGSNMGKFHCLRMSGSGESVICGFCETCFVPWDNDYTCRHCGKPVCVNCRIVGFHHYTIDDNEYVDAILLCPEVVQPMCMGRVQ